MQVTIEPGHINGTVKAPPSKSMMQRACAAALLHHGTTTILYPGYSNDNKAALRVIEHLGAKIVRQTEDSITIESNGIHPVADHIDCAESGLAARLFIPIAALSNTALTISGHGSLLTRPMDEFATLLPQLGVQLSNFNGHLPVTLQGPLQAKSILVDGSLSSQYLSGILFALAFSTTAPLTIEVHQLKSKPYIDLTLDILNRFGKTITHNNYETFYIDPAQFEEKKDITITIEGDWSNAAYWLVAGATIGDVFIQDLHISSLQADKKIAEVLTLAGANVQYHETGVHITTSAMQGFEFDATDCPDLFPALSILAAKCNGESYITGIHRLWHKESNRIESITEMLHQFGIMYSIEDDAICVRGRSKFDYATIDSYNDHRIAMAAAIGALHAKAPVTIIGAEAVNKSYPDFFKTLISLGVSVNIQDT